MSRPDGSHNPPSARTRPSHGDTTGPTKEVRLPGGRSGELRLPMCRQLVDDGPGEGALTHIGQRRLIDDVVCVSGAQQIEKVQPALARPRAEPGEVTVTDLSAEPVLAGVTCAGVIHRDPGCRLEANPQEVAGLGNRGKQQ